MHRLIITFLAILVIYGGFGQNFRLADSITIVPALKKGLLQDVFLTGGHLWCRFDEWNESDKIVELKNELGKSFHFDTTDSLSLTETGNLYPSDKGFIIPKYSGSQLMIFDTITQTLISKYIPAYISKYPFKIMGAYPNKPGNERNDICLYKKYLLIASIQHTINSKNEKTLKKSYYKKIKKDNIFLLCDIEKNEVIKQFGHFPKNYIGSIPNLANLNFSFVLDTLTGNVYTTFGGYDNIKVYNIYSGEEIEWECKGKFVRSEKLNLVIFNPTVSAMSRLYNLYLDSYTNMYLYHPYVFRVYDLAMNSDSIMSLFPKENFNVCAPHVWQAIWQDKQLLKHCYLQQLDLAGNIISDVPFPQEMNTFVGYQAGKYYFRTREHKKTTKSRMAKIYVYSLMPEVIN